MSDLTYDNAVIDAFEEALSTSESILLGELRDLSTWSIVLGRIHTICSEVYDDVCEARGIVADPEQLALLRSGLSLVAANTWDGIGLHLSEVYRLIAKVVDVFRADPVFQESLDSAGQRRRAMIILDNLAKENDIEISNEDRVELGMLIQIEWLRSHQII